MLVVGDLFGDQDVPEADARLLQPTGDPDEHDVVWEPASNRVGCRRGRLNPPHIREADDSDRVGAAAAARLDGLDRRRVVDPDVLVGGRELLATRQTSEHRLQLLLERVDYEEIDGGRDGHAHSQPGEQAERSYTTEHF